jgi:hypothetical protein
MPFPIKTLLLGPAFDAPWREMESTHLFGYLTQALNMPAATGCSTVVSLHQKKYPREGCVTDLLHPWAFPKAYCYDRRDHYPAPAFVTQDPRRLESDASLTCTTWITQDCPFMPTSLS